jgi:hypothetical protein
LNANSRSKLSITKTTSLGLAIASFVAACGGGSDSGTSAAGPAPTPAPVATPAPTPAQTPAATTITLSGIAAKGAPFSGATVIASNPTGTIGTAQTVAADGSFSLTLPIDTATPIVLIASKTLPTGESESYTSIVADTTNTTVNITPVTNVIAALLSPTGNPASLAAQVAAGTAISQASLAARTQSVQAVLQTASTALGVANVNPLTGVFAANGSGYDQLLDSINTTITPSGASSNIEIGLRVQAAVDTAQPPVAQFTSNQVSLPALPAIAASSFLSTTTTAKLAQLLADSTACYALPLATRVSTATAGATTAIGNANDVSAAACKGLFLNSNPTFYKNNGVLVGRSSTGAGNFTGLFNDASTNLVFNNAVYEYTLPSGDIAFSYRTTPASGAINTSTNFARLDPADQKLKFVGNQYDYSGGVQPFMQRREFLTLNLSQWNYFSSGYALNVDNTGQFAKVEVTTPNGITYTMFADPAVSFLKFVGKGSSNVLRFRSEFIDTTKTGSVPVKLTSENTNLAFESPEFSEAAMAAVPAQSVWTFKYYLIGNSTATPNAVQVYRTRARALTMAELRARSFPTLSATTINDIVAGANASGNFPLTSTGPATFDWTVPSGALQPTSSTLFGRSLNGVNATSTSAFTDSQSYAASTRSVSISCSVQNAADGHCTGASGGGFRPGSFANGLNLIATDSSGRQFASQYNAYNLTIAP